MRYVIQKGDTLNKIAGVFGTTVNDIMSANPKIKNKNLIYAGDTIDVPTNAAKGAKNIFSGWWDWYKNLFRF